MRTWDWHRPLLECCWLALDFETTGHVGEWPNEPWQVGWAYFQPPAGLQGQEIGGSWLKLQDRPFHPSAPGRHAQLREVLAQSPSLQDLWPDFSLRVEGQILVAHQASTERQVLKSAAPLHDFGPWVDTLRLLRLAHPELSSFRLEEAVPALGLMPKVQERVREGDFHDAIFDAVACACLLEHLLLLPGWEGVSVAEAVRASGGKEE